MYKNFIILFFLSIFSLTIFAEPAPFGLEINKTTYEEVKKKYPGVDEGINKYTLGKMYHIDIANIDMDGIKSLLTIFNQNDQLLGIMVTFDKNKYHSLFDNLKTKYKIIASEQPFVGNKIVKFQEENTIITVRAPHLSFESSLDYIHNDFEKLFLQKSQAESQQKNEKERNTL